MAQRLRLYDMRLSELPSAIGACSSDVTRIAQAVNSAQERLLYAKEGGDESWFGTWAEIVFNIDPNNPYITLPRDIARLEAIDIRDQTVPIQNQFYDYLRFGNGRLPKQFVCSCPCNIDVRTRNMTPTFVDLSSGPQIIAVYPTDEADEGKRILIQGLDGSNNVIYTQDGRRRVQGKFLDLEFPFVVSTPYQFNRILGIQKDVTAGQVQIFQMDPNTGTQVLLSTMEPGETTAWYRRYYLSALPCQPCPTNTCNGQTAPPIRATAIAKLELIPVVVDTDYCLIQNKQAIIHEAQAIRYSRIDTMAAKKFAEEHHALAIALLNGELTHYIGKNTPEVNFKPFGSARLERKNVGMI